jgi:dethiobiotin synthetase
VSDADWRGPVLVTGTDTGVGKTVVTAGLAAAAGAVGLRVAVVKPAESGVGPHEMSDVDTVVRLATPATARTLAEYLDPLAPLAAARIAGSPPLELYSVVDAVREEAKTHDLVLVEGAGGLLVPIGVRPAGQPWTVADLAVSLGAPAVVVARAGLGTLNHTALTMEALERRAVPACVVIGAWPTQPELVHVANLVDLYGQLAGAVPAGAGSIEPGVFRRSAPGWFTARLFGSLDDVRSLIEDEL